MKKEFIILCFIVLTLFYSLYIFGHTRITAEFKELEPFRHRLPVFYKGFLIRHTTKVYPGPDYTTTRIDMRIRLKKLSLPENTFAIVKSKNDEEYIELIYPKSPYITRLRTESLIEGIKGGTFETFIQEQSQNGELEEIKFNLNKTIKSAGETFDALTGMLTIISEILEDIRPNLNETALNLNKTSQNLADSTSDIKESIQKGYIDKTLLNVQQSSDNLVSSTKNFSGFTNSLNKESSILANCLLKNLNIVTTNINQVVIGLQNTLKKRFGGLRIIFGKSIQCN